MKKNAKNTSKKSVNTTAMTVAAATATPVGPIAGIAPFQSVAMRLPLSQMTRARSIRAKISNPANSTN